MTVMRLPQLLFPPTTWRGAWCVIGGACVPTNRASPPPGCWWHSGLADVVAMRVDDRLFNGINVWDKPLKFEIAIAVYLLTLAFYARFLPAAMLRGTRLSEFLRWSLPA